MATLKPAGNNKWTGTYNERSIEVERGKELIVTDVATKKPLVGGEMISFKRLFQFYEDDQRKPVKEQQFKGGYLSIAPWKTDAQRTREGDYKYE